MNTAIIKPFAPKKLMLYLLQLLVFILASGCASSTRITGTWKSQEAGSHKYDKVVVAALTDNVRAREKVETDMQAQLQMRGITVARSIDFFPPTLSSKDGPGVDALIEKLKNEEYDAIMTIALLDEKTESRYVPGNYSYTPVTRFGWYGRFSGYYTYWYPTLYNPGYYTEDKIYFLETNLYDKENENLIWSAQSESYSPASLRKASEKLAEITIARMAQDGVIK
ncbi:hypothetical protein [Pontibacter vulgaris]|uniref:hypothetical protein n=1 Tax=Pontibacter vulgaris TaxID=2905679 RepID=UPI001FA6F01E|nr:hypothetical protein [Pontibacter vulgaris]